MAKCVRCEMFSASALTSQAIAVNPNVTWPEFLAVKSQRRPIRFIADGAALYLIARDSVPLYLDMQEMSLFIGLVKYILCSKK